MTAAAADDDDDDSFDSHSSSSSDDDFLTSGAKGGSGNLTQQDREALVRKKLLESFYGASSSAFVPDEGNVGSSDDNDADIHDINLDGNFVAKDTENSKMAAKDGTGDAKKMLSGSSNKTNILASGSGKLQQKAKSSVLTPSQIPLPYTATKSDLDSPSFNPKLHALSHIAHSTTHTLLETNERLALDIRTLDSTIQTLVYENYSKFIDATDAIKSIGTNVSSISCDNKNGLDRLILGMERIQAASSRSEELLRLSRDAVAEKIRIQRLLTRLDALLSLPQTLRTYIRQEKYSMAVQSHMNATEILGKHSAGFESLRCIEFECGSILTKLVNELETKLIRWSGGGDSNDDIGENGGSPGRDTGYASALDDVTEYRPNSIGEIFECARTLIMLLSTPFSPELGRRQYQSLALAACGLFIRDRLLVGKVSSSTDLPESFSEQQHQNAGKHEAEGFEIPVAFLDGILESVTLFGVSFQGSTSPATTYSDDGRDQLGEFVLNNFDKFICHVRALLIQRSESNYSSCGRRSVKARDEDEESKDDENFLQLSIALSHLLQSVRGLASGLALPEVGVDVSLSSTIVDQAIELAEMLVTRRIAMKFNDLRAVITIECLTPLVKAVARVGNGNDSEESLQEFGQDSSPSSLLVETVQLASVALSDGLQMADDLIRATLQRSQATGTSSLGAMVPVDMAVVKRAVQNSAKSFGLWLASALEMLVGCEGSYQDDKTLLEIVDNESDDEKKGHPATKIIIPYQESNVGVGGSTRSVGSFMNSILFFSNDSSVDDSGVKDETVNLLSHLLVNLDNGVSGPAYSNFLLAICEMCRLAERSMANTLNQSIQSAMDDSRFAESAKKFFGDTVNLHRKGKDGLDSDQILPQRFRLAASRALAMYVINRGVYAASELCSDMFLMSDARDPYAIPSSPRNVCTEVFQIVKSSCEDCISIVGGDLFVAPVPAFPEEFEYVNVFGNRLVGGGSGSGGVSSGLQFDVERMFIEKSKMYPHSLDQLELTRNSVVSGILRVCLFSLLECVRSSVFSSLGYRQMKVDAIFLRYIIPHFVRDEFGTPDHNACSCLFNIIDDIMLKAGQRCFEHEVTDDDEYYDIEKDEIFTPYQLVQGFCEADEGAVMNKVAFSSYK